MSKKVSDILLKTEILAQLAEEASELAQAALKLRRAPAERAGINFEVVNSHTTADAPETVYFIREQFKAMEERGIKCSIVMPRYKDKPVSMWTLIPQKLMPPTRTVRYCCNVLKENTGKNRFIATGVRWAESARRKNSRGIMEVMHKDPAKRIILMGDNDEKRQLFETCNLKGKMTVNPIVDWSDDDVWDYTHSEHLPINPLYCEGQKRVGCIGCPMAGRGGRQREFVRWPKYEKLYIQAFDRMLEERNKRGLDANKVWDKIKTGVDMFHWWMEDGVLPGQLSMDDLMEDNNGTPE